MLHKVGMERLDESSQIIMDAIKKNNDFLPLHDKSTPDEINATLAISKKTFKKAAGMLYKKKLIEITPEGIRKLVSGEEE